jgi:5-methyltetrahydropteroyltriglutamate--homocysteine methyltransferase
MMLDLGKLLNYNFKLLAEAGCKNMQLDEPIFTIFEGELISAKQRHKTPGWNSAG